jgi:hypothetical protein
MDGLPGNPRANIYESRPGQAEDHTTPSTYVVIQPLKAKEIMSHSSSSHGHTVSADRVLRRKPYDPATRPPASKLLSAPESHLRLLSLRSWFCGSTK